MRVRVVFALLLASCGGGGAQNTADAQGDGAPGGGATASCRGIHTANPAMPSGTYSIDPDGSGGDSPISVSCDMVADGGGWTVVFFAPTAAINGLPIGYTAGNARLMADAQQILIAYRNATEVAYANYARFDVPDSWRAQTPFGFAGDDLMTAVSINGGPPATATVRYGRATFSTRCNDPWNTAGAHGRICVQNTAAPFFNGFASAGADQCSDSNQPHDDVLCTPDKRFSIAVR